MRQDAIRDREDEIDNIEADQRRREDDMNEMTADKIIQQQMVNNPDAQRENLLQQKDQFILDVDEDEEKAKKHDLIGQVDIEIKQDQFDLGTQVIDDEVQSNADTEKRGPKITKTENVEGNKDDALGQASQKNMSNNGDQIESIKYNSNVLARTSNDVGYKEPTQDSVLNTVTDGEPEMP